MGYSDAMSINGKAIVRKLDAGKNLKKRKSVDLEQCDVTITSTVQGGLITIALPEKNLHISCRMQDVLAVVSATNKAYLEKKDTGIVLPET